YPPDRGRGETSPIALSILRSSLRSSASSRRSDRASGTCCYALTTTPNFLRRAYAGSRVHAGERRRCDRTQSSEHRTGGTSPRQSVFSTLQLRVPVLPDRTATDLASKAETIVGPLFPCALPRVAPLSPPPPKRSKK